MLRTGYRILSIFLISLTCINGLSKDAGPFELAVIKAPEGPIKIRHSIPNQSYALDHLAIPYIKNDGVRASLASIYWCGTPTIQYVMEHGHPSEAFLREHAVKLEASMRIVKEIMDERAPKYEYEPRWLIPKEN